MRSRFVPLMVLVAMALTACGGGDPAGSPPEDSTADSTEGSTEDDDTTDDAEAENVSLTMGGSSSSSSVFAYLSAHARLAGDADGAMTINLRETNASTENFQLVADDAVDFGISGFETLAQAYEGSESFEDNPFPDMRLLQHYLVSAEFFTVREDAGIETVHDLDGKSIAPGFQASATADKTLNMLNALGIEVEVFDGSLEDIVNAMKDGRIVGYGKSGNGMEADSSMIDVSSAVPVKAIGWSEEDIETIQEEYPLYTFGEIEANTVFDNPEPFMTSLIVASYFTHADMDDEVAYRLTSALWETIDEAAEEGSYGGGMGRTPEETVDSIDFVPLHPGAERWYEEQGHL